MKKMNNIRLLNEEEMCTRANISLERLDLRFFLGFKVFYDIANMDNF
jgi:hypothetical protein